MSRDQARFDVIVVGQGMTGLSAAHHLAERGIHRVALVTGGPEIVASRASPGLLLGGQADNFTRVAHAHGDDFARDLWRFGNEAFEATLAFAARAGVDHARKRRLRLVVAEDELRETEKAVAALMVAGFPVRLIMAGEADASLTGLTERVLAVQDEGNLGAWVDLPALLDRLAASHRAKVFDQAAAALEVGGGGARVTLADGRILHGEVVVLAAHLAIARFLPALSETLVAVADQWSLMATTGAPAFWRDSGIVFSAHHGYEWGVTCSDGRVVFGGGRFLRKLAGIGATQAVVEDKITRFLQGQLGKTFAWGDSASVLSSAAGLDCRPCDELPIIGPMFGEGRVLLATGYMGSGLTAGFYAGSCLAELIATGKCARLPTRLWPARLRSLES